MTMPIRAETASWPVLRLRMLTPRANSCAMVAVVKAQKPKQITAAGGAPSPMARQTPDVTAAALRGQRNW